MVTCSLDPISTKFMMAASFGPGHKLRPGAVVTQGSVCASQPAWAALLLDRRRLKMGRTAVV